MNCTCICYVYMYAPHANLDGAAELLQVVNVALDDEGDHSPKALALSFGQLVLWVCGQTRVHSLHDVRRCFEELCDDHGALLVTLHADVEGLEATVRQVAVKGTRDWTTGCEGGREGGVCGEGGGGGGV